MMKKLTFRIYFKREAEFAETDFIEFIESSLKGLNVAKVLYSDEKDYFIFQITYKEIMPDIIGYRPILGCFSGLEYEYGHVSNVTIPVEYMSLEDA